MSTFMIFLSGLLGLLLVVLIASIRILREYERAVVFTLGRFTSVKGPGLTIVVPIVQSAEIVELRTLVMDVPSQDVISKDNVSVKVNAVVYFRVLDPEKAIIQVADFFVATSELAQTTLRSVLGGNELDEILSEREKFNNQLRAILDEQTDAWGIKISNVELKHVDLDESMIRAIARQAEAERERRAKIIHAEGEMQASQKLLTAAQTLDKNSKSLLLRYLQTLTEIAGEKSNTIAFPLPMDLIVPMMERFGGPKKSGDRA